MLDTVVGTKWLNLKVEELIPYTTLLRRGWSSGFLNAEMEITPDAVQTGSLTHLQRSFETHDPASWDTWVRTEDRNMFGCRWRAYLEMQAPEPAVSVAPPYWQARWLTQCLSLQSTVRGSLRSMWVSHWHPCDGPCMNGRGGGLAFHPNVTGSEVGTGTLHLWALSHSVCAGVPCQHLHSLYPLGKGCYQPHL